MITLKYPSGSITLPNPMLGYKSRIDLSVDYITLDDGSVSGYDNGAAWDRRTCDCMLIIPASDQAKLNQLLSVDARGTNLGLQLDGSGFFPFMPDKGDSGAFTVSAVVKRQTGILGEPWKYFQTELKITNLSTFPAYVAPTLSSEGSVTIGTVSNLRYPPDLAQPNTDYAIDTQVSEGSTAFYSDRSSTRDHFSTNLGMSCNAANMAALVAYLTATARAATFTMSAPSDNYVFGYDNGGAGNYVVRMTENSFETTHILPDQFTIDLSLDLI